MQKLHDFQFFTLETIVIQTIILLLILWVLNRFIFKPYLDYLDKEMGRKEKLEKDYNNIDALNKEALEKRKALLTDARIESNKIRQDAIEIAKSESQAILEKAHLEAENLKKSALNDISRERQNMLNDLKSKSVDLILKFNQKLFQKEKVNKDFIEKEIDSFNV